MRRTLCRPGGAPRPPAALAAYEPGSTAQASAIFLGGMLHAPISELSSLEFYPPRPGATSTREETCPFRCPSSNGARCRCPPVTRSVTIHPYDRYQRSGCRDGLVGLPAGPSATARIGPSGDEIFRGADHMVPHRGPRPRRRCRSRWPRRRHCAAGRPYCRLLCPARPHDRHPARALRRLPRVRREDGEGRRATGRLVRRRARHARECGPRWRAERRPARDRSDSGPRKFSGNAALDSCDADEEVIGIRSSADRRVARAQPTARRGTTASMSFTAEIPAVPCTAIIPIAGNATH